MSVDPEDPDTCPAQSFSLAEVFRIVGVALVAGAAIGYLLATYHDGTIEVLARIACIVSMTTVILMIFEVRRRHRIDRVDQRLARLEVLLDERLERDRRWRVYGEVLEDLGGIGGGIDGESSTDSGRLPPRG